MAKITLIGSGNTATTLGKALLKAGHQIMQVWSRDTQHAHDLAALLQAIPITDLNDLLPAADCYLLAVKDDAIEEVAAKLKVADKIVAHCSGIRSKDLLKICSNNYGVFYPNVSMTKNVEVGLAKVLIMIEGSNAETVSQLNILAGSVSDNVKTVEEKQRQSLHVSAVFANNFTNHLFAIAEKILAEQGLAFDDIRPMMMIHFQNLMQQSPASLQTGPALRHDASAIAQHWKLIEGKEDMQEIYLLMTRSIQVWHKQKG